MDAIFKRWKSRSPTAGKIPIVAKTGLPRKCRETMPTIMLRQRRYHIAEQEEQSMKCAKSGFNYLAALLLPAMGMLAGNASALEFELTMPPGMPEIVTIAPEESYPITVDIRNVDDEAGIAYLVFTMDLGSDYQFGPGSPVQCGTPSGPVNGHWWYPMSLALGETDGARFH